MRVIKNKTMRVESTRSTVKLKCRVELKSIACHACGWLDKKTTTTKKQIAEHVAGAYESKMYVYYNEFKVMLVLELELMIVGLHFLRFMH
jgi:hypothetical protein